MNKPTSKLVPQQRRSNTSAKAIKADGAVYTPPELASFVAGHMLDVAKIPKTGPVYILDPAVGDGALLDALLQSLEPAVRRRAIIQGYDTDNVALDLAKKRLLLKYPKIKKVDLRHEDFLAVTSSGQKYDLIIANPPYVRTQILGKEYAQLLAERYSLTGRVDLYYPFLLGISDALSITGTSGIITSNRFLSTNSGQNVRRSLLERFRLRKVFDLGDTKLFEAAVLPAITIAQGMGTQESSVDFRSIYETTDSANKKVASVFDALDKKDGDVLGVGNTHYRVLRGVLDNGGNLKGVWRLSNKSGNQWLETVKTHTWKTFGDLGKIRVGVKTTADSVFIRSDWDTLKGGRPELLKPLLTRECANHFNAIIPVKPEKRMEILYTHIIGVNGRKEVVDLNQNPISLSYLKQHRARLEGRKYVIEAGRAWFEIWVPQDPAGWEFPKLVFPDISEKPVAWIDQSGAIVSGECYFMRVEHEDPDLLWLAMAVFNSSFIGEFYDLCFNNKLYSGKRRFITQYVEQFPLPDPARSEVREIIRNAKQIYTSRPGHEKDEMAIKLDNSVRMAFGLK